MDRVEGMVQGLIRVCNRACVCDFTPILTFPHQGGRNLYGRDFWRGLFGLGEYEALLARDALVVGLRYDYARQRVV